MQRVKHVPATVSSRRLALIFAPAQDIRRARAGQTAADERAYQLARRGPLGGRPLVGMPGLQVGLAPLGGYPAEELNGIIRPVFCGLPMFPACRAPRTPECNASVSLALDPVPS